MLAGTDAGGVGGGILLFSPRTHTGTHTHTQERTRECCTYPLATYPLKSEELKKAVAASEETIQQHSRRRGQFFRQPFSLPESAQTLAGIAFRAARKSVRNFPAALKFAENFSSKEFRTATDFSSYLIKSARFMVGSMPEIRNGLGGPS